jgi:hypothetical protein
MGSRKHPCATPEAESSYGLGHFGLRGGRCCAVCSKNVRPDARNSPISFVRTEDDLSLHKPVEGSILTPKPPGI